MIKDLILDVANSRSIFDIQGCLFGTIESLDLWNMKFPCTRI